MSCNLLSEYVNIEIYTNSILRAVLYGYETWSLALREEYRLRFSENLVLGEFFGPKTVKVAGEWEKVHEEQLHDRYSLPAYSGDKIKKNELGEICDKSVRKGWCVQGVGGEHVKERDNLEDLGLQG
jgi:hypothetical protein